MKTFKCIGNPMNSFIRANPRIYLIILLALSLGLLYGLIVFLSSSAVAAKTGGQSPLYSGAALSTVLTTTTPTASFTPTSTPSGTVTATITVTASPTIAPTYTPTPSPTATPTLTELLSFLPAISKQIPTPTPTPSPTPIPLGLHGIVTVEGVPTGGVILDLRFYNGSSWSTFATTMTGWDGSYSIINMPSLNPGQGYYIRYLNDTDPTRMFTWHTEVVETYQTGSNYQFATFDIGNIHLLAPEAGSQVDLPYAFLWLARQNVPTDNYEFNLFDPFDGDPYFWTNPALGYENSYFLSGLPDGFEVEQWYGWDVWVYTPSGNPYDGYGLSFYFYYVMFTSEGLTFSAPMPHLDAKRAEDWAFNERGAPFGQPDPVLDE